MNDRKLKVYLDTSVISHLWQIDAPEKMQETLVLWEEFKRGIYMRHPDGTYDLTIEDIPEIRERNYETTKHMTTKERIEYINRKGREAAKSLGLVNAEVADSVLV